MYSLRGDSDLFTLPVTGLLGSAFVVVSGGVSTLDEPYGGGTGD